MQKIKTEKKETKEEVDKNAARKLGLSRREQLIQRVNEFKRDFQIKKCSELIESGSTYSKVMALYTMIANANYNNLFARERIKSILKGLGIYKSDSYGYKPDIRIGKVMELTESEIEVGIHQFAIENLNDVYNNKDLNTICDAAGIDLKKHFVITDEFLKLFQKDQLITLSKELGIKIEGLTKNPEIRDAIIKNWKKGQVPKILGGN